MTLPPLVRAHLVFDEAQLLDWCIHWKVLELALFGSVLREDFRSDSDVDVMVRFSKDAQWSLFDHFQAEEDLSGILGRRAEIVTRPAVESSPNSIRRRSILETAEVVYAA